MGTVSFKMRPSHLKRLTTKTCKVAPVHVSMCRIVQHSVFSFFLHSPLLINVFASSMSRLGARSSGVIGRLQSLCALAAGRHHDHMIIEES